MVSKRKLSASIEKVSHIVLVTRSTLRQSVITQTESKAMEKLEFLTKEFARLVCDYYRKTRVWEPEFPRMILDNPDQSYKILNDYFRMCRTV